jgi:hypothetical protein
LADPKDGRTRRFVIQSGDNGDGDEPVFALSRKPEQESVSSNSSQRKARRSLILIKVDLLDIYIYI